MLAIAISLLNMAVLAQNRQADFRLDSIASPLDGNWQQFYYYASTASGKQPLVVVLHQWSYGYQAREFNLREQAKAKNWNYVFPDFRGPNNHPKACCSDYVISDIDEAIEWALQHLNVDKRRVYVVGVSGGGYAALCTFMKSRQPVAAFSAWVPITDLESWYHESMERKARYAGDILHCTGAAGNQLNVSKARARSPMHWPTPVQKLKKTRLQLYAGIHDGHTGSVPISHSLRFYNKLLTDLGVKDSSRYIPEADIKQMLNQQSFPVTNLPKIGERDILYRKLAGNVSITIFEGSHEMLSEVALDQL